MGGLFCLSLVTRSLQASPTTSVGYWGPDMPRFSRKKEKKKHTELFSDSPQALKLNTQECSGISKE